ncbi:hypothetical protein FNV43_RR18663 [Rhamnella rubrinervis]|uniref:DUF241 domain protein n=1 Tax=Rhamnella rubrinervis TaxID=2594499 RepID=A0A8K0GVV5_9ROSA|nr:hypothetical protein FNV43_RR18663 [Rhamnella rubrinervis]
MANRYHVRSISFPARSHPTTSRVEEELNKFKTCSSSTSESICSGLSRLEDLYECVEDLLNMGSTQQVLSRHRDQKYVDELVDGSVKLVDICGILRDLMLQTNEHVRALQSALRRRKGDSSIETSITSYNCFRKKMKKDVKKLMMALKQVDKNFESSSPAVDQDDHHLCAVIRVLREACGMNISIFQSLCVFLTVSGSKTKSSRWSLVSKLMHKGSVVALACEDKEESVYEMQGVDSALCMISLGAEYHAEKMQTGLKRLKALENSINGLENGLESVFRRLIKTRTSLLNVISQ